MQGAGAGRRAAAMQIGGQPSLFIDEIRSFFVVKGFTPNARAFMTNNSFGKKTKARRANAELSCRN
ncbi:hypothetical protein M2341_001394 [Sphingobium sp. B7D2B]|uniref:hypothetical protein n=1 Tax=Sphingobium sp. B7D2B TaxID=2940583 RepID=UPI0022250475|nr:hypothetical protein [Sphingobium sp. B7D2B]MCW2365947.1 hypothetical protein [Sphingobium sp. B7D2B]